MSVDNSIELSVSSRAIPFVEHLLGVWAIEPAQFDSLLSVLQNLDVQLHLNNLQAAQPETKTSGSPKSRYRQDLQGVSVITATGTLQKHEASFTSSTSTVALRRDLRSAAHDSDIGAILLAIDSSPGGTAAGTPELANEIAMAAKKKPFFCHINDLGASAAYWIASQCTKITANEAGLVGSIGTFSVITDMSGAAAQSGMKVHVVKYGAFKGMGTPGSEVTPDQLAEMQRIVDSRQEFFSAAVASGRKLSAERVAQLADGRVHPSIEAVRLGLIDGIASFEEAFDEARAAAQQSSSSKSKKGYRMDTNSTSELASVSPAAIKAACPGCSADFIVASLEAGRTLEQCRESHMTALVARNAELAKQFEELKSSHAQSLTDLSKLQSEVASLKTENAELAKRPLASTKPGVRLLPDTGSSKADGDASDPASSYWNAVSRLQAEEKLSRAQAMSKVGREQPQLREAMLAQVN